MTVLKRQCSIEEEKSEQRIFMYEWPRDFFLA